MDENKNTFEPEVEKNEEITRGYRVTPDGGFYDLRQADKPIEVGPAVLPTEQVAQPEPAIAQPAAPVYMPSYASEFVNIPKKPKKEKRKYGIGVVIVSVVLSVVLGAVAAVGTVVLMRDDDKAESAPSESGGNIVHTTINVDKTTASAIEAVAEKAGPSVVGIRTTAAVNNLLGGSNDSTGEGSGVIYTSDGYIITNHHVIESVIGQTSERAKIEVFLNDGSGDSYSAAIIGYNINSDLAVIKIDAKNLPAAEIGDSDKLKTGQFVAAIGCPGGLDFMGSVSYGIVSGLDRSFDTDDEDSVALIQTDAAINPGNSGGALLDIEGKLIGINSAKIAATAYEGMGFAIPINSAVEICDQIIARKDDPEPYIGISISTTYDEATLLGLGYPAGAVVASVVTGGPSDEAGIRRGDIITEFADKKISSYEDLFDVISTCSVGDTVTVKLYRAGRYYSAELEISSNNAY